MIALRRYEILLPSKFNDGRPIPPDLIAETLLELEREFGAASCQASHGFALNDFAMPLFCSACEQRFVAPGG